MQFKLKNIYLLALLVFAFSACKKEDDLSKPILGLEGDTWVNTRLDDWLISNFTNPYNIEVKYRWDATELGIGNTLVPPDTANIRPLMTMVKQAWIDVYTAEAGQDFIKRLAPKQYLLVGSLKYTGSTVTLGEAESGRRITLFDVNTFSTSNRTKAKRVLKTIHHEFAHILHQTIMYPVEFKSITPSGYSSAWNQSSVAEAREEGFITNYAKSEFSEDFVEMAAIMITEGRDGYNAILNSISSTTARANIKKKEDIVVTYFKQTWNIDLFRIMDLCQEALNQIAPPPPLANSLGFGKTYTSISLDPAMILLQSADFLTAYNTAKSAMLAAGGGRQLDGIYFQFTGADKGSLRISYRNSANAAFVAYFGYDVTVNASGVATFTYTGPLSNTNTNSTTISPFVTALTAYFSGQFNMKWRDGAPSDQPPYYGGFYKVGSTTSSVYGLLGN